MVVSRKQARTQWCVIYPTMIVEPKMFYVVLFAAAVLDGWVCQVSGQATGGMGATDYYNRGGHGGSEQWLWKEELKEFLRSELKSIVEVMHEDMTVKIEAVRDQLDRSRNERLMERQERREAMVLITNGIESVREQLSRMQNASQATVDEMRMIGKQLVRIHNKLNTYIDEEKDNRQKLNESFEVQKDIKLIGIQLLGIFNDSKLDQQMATSSLKAIEDKLTLFPIQIEQQIGNVTVVCTNSIGKQEPLLQTLIDFNSNISKSLPITNEQQVRIQDQLARAQLDRQVMNSTMVDMVESISNQLLRADFDRQNLSRSLEQIQNTLAQAENDRQMVNQTIVNELKTIGDQLDQVQAHGAFQNLSHNLVRIGNQSQNINFCQWGSTDDSNEQLSVVYANISSNHSLCHRKQIICHRTRNYCPRKP